MEAALKLTNLEKDFGTVKAVQGISLDIKPGEIFALLGPNGAGKSTTINMICGLTRPTGGSASIFGFDVERDYVNSRRLTGVMHQELIFDTFFRLNDALKIHAGYYGRKDDPTWRQTLIDRLALGPYVNRKPVQLSGGTKRRFMLAKALIHKPRFLILDEPTAGVDVELRHNLWQFVREINKNEGTTILLTTHYLEEAEQLCKRVAIMNKGKIVAFDETKKLMAGRGDSKLILHLSGPLKVPVEGGTSSEDGMALTMVANTGNDLHQMLERSMKALAEQGLRATDVETHKPDLEDVFLELTK